MLYDISLHTTDVSPEWAGGVGGILAKLTNGKEVKIPILESTNVLTVGVVGTGKSILHSSCDKVSSCRESNDEGGFF